MCEWSNPWCMLIVFVRRAPFLIYVIHRTPFTLRHQIHPQPFKRSPSYPDIVSPLVHWWVVMHSLPLLTLTLMLKILPNLFRAHPQGLQDMLLATSKMFVPIIPTTAVKIDWRIPSGPQNSTASTWCRENMQPWVGGEKCCFRGEQAKEVEEEEYSRRVSSIWSWDQDACKEIWCDGWNVFPNYWGHLAANASSFACI